MKMLVTWKTHQEKKIDVLRNWSSMTAEERAAVGPGVTLIGRWHSLAEGRGAAVFEVSDLAAFERYSGMWSPVMELQAVPVLDDEESAAVARQIVANSGGR